MNDFRLSKDVRPRRYDIEIDLDLDGWRSTGRASIEVALAHPARSIALHSVDLDIMSARVDGAKTRAVTYDTESQTATLELTSEAGAGEHVIELAWKGEIREALRGLYRSVRPNERYAATQFEAADARRALPCFDEPEFKARFRLALVHPSGLVALANMAIESGEDVGGGRTRTRFVETPLISSYLLAFTVGPYEATPVAKTKSGVPVRVVLPPGLAQRGIYARDAHVRALEWLEDYTGIPYPYGKLDAIGLPDFEAGAMENPGAIIYRARYLAADKETASIGTFKVIFGISAHELTHMWWGDLVTMAWWEDLWLNESFASFVGDKATAALNPEWEFWRDVVADIAPAFNLDSLVTTHPISQDVRNADQASERFDAITYNKGQAVLRMIESYIGEDAFREGVRIYLRRHREANATAADFWRALDEASGRDVTRLASAWIKEAGHPLVSCSVRETGGGLEVTARQQRFFADPDVADTGQVWPVPLPFVFGAADGRRESMQLLDSQEATFQLTDAAWYHPNSGATSFFRAALDARSVALLARGTGALRAEERLRLVDDQWALARARKAGIGRFIELVSALRGERDRAVLQLLYDVFGWLSHHAVRDGFRADFERLVEAIYRPELDALGWDVRPDDTSDERQKRATALAALALCAGARDVRSEARRRVEAHLDGRAKLHPDVAGAIVAAGAIEGDSGLYERYIARMTESAATDPQEEGRFRNALAEFRDGAIVQRFAESIFTPLIREQDRSQLLSKLLSQRHSRDAAFRLVRDAWEEHVVPMDPANKQGVVGAIGQLTPRALAPAATAFLESKRSSDITETVGRSVERLRILSATAERMAEELPDALRGVRIEAGAPVPAD